MIESADKLVKGSLGYGIFASGTPVPIDQDGSAAVVAARPFVGAWVFRKQYLLCLESAALRDSRRHDLAHRSHRPEMLHGAPHGDTHLLLRGRWALFVLDVFKAGA